MAAVLMAALRNQRPNPSPKPRSSSGPPAEEWTATLPLEIVCKAIDQLDPVRDILTIKALTLTCRELKSYCRPIIFSTIGIGYDERLEFALLLSKSTVRLPKPSESLRRLALLLKESPDIADFVMTINISWTPYPAAFERKEGSQCCESEALFSFVLDRRFPMLQDLTINVKKLSFKDLSSGVQHSLLNLMTSPKLLNFFVAMQSFPNTVLEQARHVRILSLCGIIYPDPRRPQLPLAIDPSVALPHTLEMCHVPEESLPLLTQDQSPRFDSGHLRNLRFGDSDIYSVAQDALIRKSARSLVSLSLSVKNWQGSLVLLPVGELSALTSLEVNVAFDGSQSLLYALSWLAASVGKSANPKSMGKLGVAVILSMPFLPGLNVMGLNSTEGAMVFRVHKGLWDLAVSVNHSWPDLRDINIHGGSETLVGNTLRIQCLGSLWNAGHEGHGHE